MAHEALFSPVRIGAVDVTNRIFLAPLTRNRATPDGVPGPFVAEYYAQRASGGLLITEATQISPMGKGYINTPGIHSDAQIARWKEITDGVHALGGKIALQLWHVGRISHSSLLPGHAQPVSASGVRANAQTFIETGLVDTSQPRALSIEEIQATIADYALAARNAIAAGFDLVEVHAANGYLIDQFLRDGSNRRDDEYGGSAENRVRFLREVVAAIVDAIGADRVGVRLSPTGQFNDMADSDPATTFTTAVEALNAFDLAYLHMVEEFPGVEGIENADAVLAAVRQTWDGFYVANGGYSAERAAAAVVDGHADAVAIGRDYIANPDLPERIRADAPLNEGDQATYYGGGAEGYTDYPALQPAE